MVKPRQENVPKPIPASSSSSATSFPFPKAASVSADYNSNLCPMTFSERFAQAQGKIRLGEEKSKQHDAKLTKLKAEKWRLESDSVHLELRRKKLESEIQERKKYESAKVNDFKQKVTEQRRTNEKLREKRGDEMEGLKLLRLVHSSLKDSDGNGNGIERKCETASTPDLNNNWETDGETTEELFVVTLPSQNSNIASRIQQQH